MSILYQEFLLFYSVWFMTKSYGSTELINFGFKSGINVLDNCNNCPVTVTLWYNHVIYQTAMPVTNTSTWYLSSTFTLLGLSDCLPNTGNSETKVMIDSNTPDTLKLSHIKITTANDWYGIASFRTLRGEVNGVTCFDNKKSGCGAVGTGGIYKQMFHFDITKPNEWIESQLIDAQNIFPEEEVQTCDPSQSPTEHPSTLVPTKAPTTKPTSIPTGYPTSTPTAPTRSPTVYPTPKPTHIVTVASIVSTDDNQDDDDRKDLGSAIKDDFNGLSWVVWVLVCLSLILCCVMFAGVVWYRSHKAMVDDGVVNISISTAIKVEEAQKKPLKVNDLTHGQTDGNDVINVELVMKGSAKMTHGQKADNVVRVVDMMDSDPCCSTCGKQHFGKIYDGDGLFYCNHCRE
eukprot:990637_1